MNGNIMILGNEVSVSLDDYKTKRNNNVLVVGSPGSGKTLNIISPNIAQCVGSYVISDPKGNLYDRFKDKLRSEGYVVRYLDFFHSEKSTDKYSFFNYIRTEQDVIKIADLLVYAENGRETHSYDPFWDQAGQILLQAIIAYLWEYCRPDKRSMYHINRMLSRIRIPEENELFYQDETADLMKSLPEESLARKSYEKFLMAAPRTLRSILITLEAHVGRWDIEAINDLMSDDTMNLDRLGKEKTAIFIATSDTDRSMDGLINLFFEQTFQELCRYADMECPNQRLPIPVRFMLDDFANTVCIRSIPTAIAGVRSRGISFILCIQAEHQLARMYEEDAETIIGSCDTYLYMGSNDVETARHVAERCNQPLHKILEMPIGYSWLLCRGEKPQYIQNYDYLSTVRDRTLKGKEADEERR